MSDEVTPPPDDRDPTAEQEGSDRPTPVNPAHPVHPYPAGGTPGGPSRRIRNGSAELPPLPPGWVIPDDLSELDDEVHAYRKEWRTAHPTRWRRLLWPPWLRRQRHNLPLLLLGLLSVAVFATLVSVPAPTRQPLPPPAALAHPKVSPGSVGGLVPQVTLYSGPAQTTSRDLRPALLVLLPPRLSTVAGSRDTVSQIAAQAEEFQLVTILIAGPGDAGSVKALAETARRRGVVTGLEDRGGVLAKTYGKGPDPLLLTVARDGRLVQPPFPFHQGDRIEPLLDAVSPFQPS
ncbi:MAG: hypothetical protein ACXV5Q_02335 [Frankiaceae bacterium]